MKEESEKAGLKLNIQKTKSMASSPITSWQIDGAKSENWHISFSWGPKSLWTVIATEIKRCLLLGRRAMINLNGVLKIRDIISNKGLSSHSYGFSSSHVWMWELDHK